MAFLGSAGHDLVRSCCSHTHTQSLRQAHTLLSAVWEWSSAAGVSVSPGRMRLRRFERAGESVTLQQEGFVLKIHVDVGRRRQRPGSHRRLCSPQTSHPCLQSLLSLFTVICCLVVKCQNKLNHIRKQRCRLSRRNDTAHRGSAGLMKD